MRLWRAAVERVTFHNPENGFCVLKVQVRGKRDLVVVVGHTPSVGAGEWITASGAWVSDRTHGLQFKAEVLKTTPPTGAEGIEKYLASGQMRGIGPAMAKRIVAAFGEATFDIIEANPERLTEVSGIGPWRAARIVAGWAEQKAVREIMIFLHAHGVGTARAVRIFKTYGHEAIQVMTEDPYRLARDVRGIGFRTADAIAAKLGMEKTAPQRLRAGVSFALQTATDEGHCALPVAMLASLAQKLLEVEAPLIEVAIAEELRRGEEVVSDTVGQETCVFLKGLHGAERAIADRLIARAEGNPPWPAIDLDRALPWVESEDRQDAVRLAARGRPAGAVLARVGDDRRPWGGQDLHPRQPPAHPGREGRAGAAGGSDRPRRQAHDGADRDGGEDHPPPAGDRPQARRLLADGGQPARLRPAGRGRDLDGRCAAHERADQGRAGACGPAARRATWTSCPPSGRGRCWPT